MSARRALVLILAMAPPSAWAKGQPSTKSTVIETGAGRTVSGVAFPAGARVELVARGDGPARLARALLRRGGSLCGFPFAPGSEVAFRAGAPRLRLDVSPGTTSVGFDERLVAVARGGRLADDAVIEGTFYPAGTNVVFDAARRLVEVGIFEPLLIAGWDFPAWSIVRFDRRGNLARAETTRGADTLVVDGSACAIAAPADWDEGAPRQLDCGRSCIVQAPPNRAMRLYSSVGCREGVNLLAQGDVGRSICGLDAPLHDPVEVAVGNGAIIYYWRPSADVQVQGMSFLRGRRLAIECREDAHPRVRLGTLAAPARVGATVFPARTQLRAPPDDDRLEVRLPFPVTAQGVRWPGGTLLEIRAGRVRRAALTINAIHDGVTIGGRVCRLSPADPIEAAESGEVARCTAR